MASLSVPALTVRECDLRVVKYNKPFPPCATFGYGVLSQQNKNVAGFVGHCYDRHDHVFGKIVKGLWNSGLEKPLNCVVV